MDVSKTMCIKHLKLLSLIYGLIIIAFAQSVYGSEKQTLLKNQLIIYSPFPQDITKGILNPMIQYLQSNIGVETIIPHGSCSAYKKFKAGNEALVLPEFSLWGALLKRGYTPIVVSIRNVVVFGISKHEITTVEDFTDKEIAADPNTRILYKHIFDGNAAGIWSTIKFINSSSTNDSIMQVLNGEAKYGITGSITWQLTSPAIKEKLHAFSIESNVPNIVIFAHPKLSRKQQLYYQSVFSEFEKKSAMLDWMKQVGIENFVEITTEKAEIIESVKANQPSYECWDEQ